MSFDRVTEIFGTRDLSPQEQVQQLLAVPISELRAKVGRQVPLGPMVDGDLIHELTTYQGLAEPSDFTRIFPGTGHCKRIIVGDCQMDVSRNTPFPVMLHRTDLVSTGRGTCASSRLSQGYHAPDASSLCLSGSELYKSRR